MVSSFSKYIKNVLPKLIEPIWNCVVNGYIIYYESAIKATNNNNNNSQSSFQDYDGEVLGFETLVNQIWEFFQCILESEQLHSILKSHLTALMYVGIGYAQITAEQQDLWISDPNQFAADEQDEAYNYSIRMSIINFICVNTQSKKKKKKPHNFSLIDLNCDSFFQFRRVWLKNMKRKELQH